jgi:hypothetical protein
LQVDQLSVAPSREMRDFRAVQAFSTPVSRPRNDGHNHNMRAAPQTYAFIASLVASSGCRESEPSDRPGTEASDANQWANVRIP